MELNGIKRNYSWHFCEHFCEPLGFFELWDFGRRDNEVAEEKEQLVNLSNRSRFKIQESRFVYSVTVSSSKIQLASFIAESM